MGDRAAEPDSTWRAVAFDLDGTLFDHRGSATSAVRHVIASYDRSATTELVTAWFDIEAEHFEAWRGGRVTFVEQRRLRLRSFLPLLGIRASASDHEIDSQFDRYLKAYRRSWRAFDDAVPLLERVRSKGALVGVLTNGNHAQQIDKLEVTGLLPLIDVVCTSEEIGHSKPDRRAFEILAERLGVPTREIAFVGDDADKDVAGARGAGMAAGLVDHVERPNDTLSRALRQAAR